jgi:hypothetical protein
MKGMSCFIRGKGNKVKWNSLQSDESITKRIVSLYINISHFKRDIFQVLKAPWQVINSIAEMETWVSFLDDPVFH